MSEMLNCMVLIGENLAIRADQVRRIDVGLRRTRVVMADGFEYSTSMPVSELANAVNDILNAARAALQGSSP